MQNNVINPDVFWIEPNVVRFSFSKEVSIENVARLQRLNQLLTEHFQGDIVELVPGYHTLTVYLKPNHSLNIEQLFSCWTTYAQPTNEKTSNVVTIPVCYDEEFALDMERIMAHTRLCFEEIIAIHSGQLYEVFLVGFLPGFPYLGVLDERIRVPRLPKARTRVEAGSVGIGGEQTGMYPLASPGGWNILGRTPLPIVNLQEEPHFFFSPQTKVQIERISKSQFENMQKKGVALWKDYLQS